jgi:tRNA A37 threonylcarbamoyladenosine modification protein TsaB
MNLFLDTISSLGNILLFDHELQVVDNFSWGVKGIEISSIVPSVDAVLKKNKIDYPQLENIFVVNGP